MSSWNLRDSSIHRQGFVRKYDDCRAAVTQPRPRRGKCYCLDFMPPHWELSQAGAGSERNVQMARAERLSAFSVHFPSPWGWGALTTTARWVPGWLRGRTSQSTAAPRGRVAGAGAAFNDMSDSSQTRPRACESQDRPARSTRPSCRTARRAGREVRAAWLRRMLPDAENTKHASASTSAPRVAPRPYPTLVPPRPRARAN